jgi:hypothetical protein
MRLSAFASQSKNSKERRDRDTSRRENGERYTEKNMEPCLLYKNSGSL